MTSMNKLSAIACFLGVSLTLSSCKIYSFKDVSIPAAVKSIHIGYIENRARLINPQLAPQLNDKLRQKINQQPSNLTQKETSNPDYEVNGIIPHSHYTTSAILHQPPSTTR